MNRKKTLIALTNTTKLKFSVVTSTMRSNPTLNPDARGQALPNVRPDPKKPGREAWDEYFYFS
jgi:hypothetical protein